MGVRQGHTTVGAAMRQVLAELSMTSTVPSRVLVGLVTGSAPTSSILSGPCSPADAWRERFEGAAGDEQRWELVGQAHDELHHLRRRKFAVGPTHDGDDLRERVVRDGVGDLPATVAIALRCTPTFVRRVRLAAGMDAENGRSVSARDPAGLRKAGLSLRAIATVTGIPRSTLHDQLTNTNN